MIRERFEYLADAYGGDLRRWPEAEREAARALAATDLQAAALLREADGLDALLDAAPRVVASHALRERVIAAAAGAGLGRRRRGLGVMAWLSGAGWAAAACAGAVFGVVLTGQMTADIRADTVLYQASLTSADDTEVLGG
ncbi:hypothetical protein [Brevundimonas sp.]|uniref:hypothetical protein n=1 Tax=Brevundimonas sp. TaxID=1871086 RepID=UPI0028A644EC|nr:hypothetical protein [Brevundimonas sp.]